MPPKAKFTREEIIEAAVRITERDGADALTARALAAELGSSARPVFTVFENMEEVQECVKSEAERIYARYIKRGLESELAFKGVGESYITFAAEKPKLFQLLFMREARTVPDLHSVLGTLDKSYEKILQSIVDGYGVPAKTAESLYLHLWIYSHGVAVLLATRVCAFKSEEISEMLTQVFKSLLVNCR